MSLTNTNLIIQGSHLPPTFKGTPDDLFMAMLERMKIVSPVGTSFFVISDNMPSSNQGPWLKGGKQWFVWDEELKTYVPLDISASEKIWFQISVTVPATATPPLWLQVAADGNPVAWNWWNGSTWVDFTTLKDRSVTSSKLHYFANFYLVASGLNDYTAAVFPGTGFGYGDGVNTSFAAFVKFPATNTGAVTLNINGLSPRPVKKQTNQSIEAGEIVAGSVHLLSYDGENFQVLSPLQELPPVVHGIPNFFETIEIYNGPAIGWTVYNNLLADGVPATASAAILEFVLNSGPNEASIKIRKISGAPEYFGASTTNSSQTACQGIFPIITQTFTGLGFNFEAIGDVDFAIINLIGYIS